MRSNNRIDRSRPQFSCALALMIAMVAGSIAWSAEPPPSVRARDLLGDIKIHGAKFVVEKLWDRNRQWDAVMAKIATGKKDWLDVAAALRPGTDAGASETLDEALFLALASAPVGVLKLLDGHPFDTDFVCSSNIGTDYPPQKSLRFVRDRIEVLRGVSDADLQAVRTHCLKNLKLALKELADSR
jgi:hypothetical protein